MLQWTLGLDFVQTAQNGPKTGTFAGTNVVLTLHASKTGIIDYDYYYSAFLEMCRDVTRAIRHARSRPSCFSPQQKSQALAYWF